MSRQAIKHTSNIAFNDFLFNVIVCIALFFFIAFMLINPIAKQADVEVNAEVLIQLSWPEESNDDLDLWVYGGDLKRPIHFRNKEELGWTLERDDRGYSKDTFVVNGKTLSIPDNAELITMRGILPGLYTINVHVYHKSDVVPRPFQVKLIDLNPSYKELVIKQDKSVYRDQVTVITGFEVHADGSVTVFDSTENVLLHEKSNRSYTSPSRDMPRRSGP